MKKVDYMLILDLTKDIIIDYLNKDIKESELLELLDIKKCECGHYCRAEDMVDTEGKLNGGIGEICTGCAEDKDIAL